MTILFGLVARLPFAFAAGLGINSFLAVAVVGQVTWPEAMGLVVINGLIIVLLAATGLRRLIFNAVPIQLKLAITVGIGLFIAFIGFVDAGFVTSTGAGSPPVGLGVDGSVATVPTLIFVFTLLLTRRARRAQGQGRHPHRPRHRHRRRRHRRGDLAASARSSPTTASTPAAGA